MSADNGIYIAEFPTLKGKREWRVAHAFESFVTELETPYYTPEEHREAVMSVWDGPVFTKHRKAIREAFRLLDEIGYTEYGVCQITMPVPWGKKKKKEVSYGYYFENP
jgi:hypothetical protein